MKHCHIERYRLHKHYNCRITCITHYFYQQRHFIRWGDVGGCGHTPLWKSFHKCNNFFFFFLTTRSQKLFYLLPNSWSVSFVCKRHNFMHMFNHWQGAQLNVNKNECAKRLSDNLEKCCEGDRRCEVRPNGWNIIWIKRTFHLGLFIKCTRAATIYLLLTKWPSCIQFFSKFMGITSYCHQ